MRISDWSSDVCSSDLSLCDGHWRAAASFAALAGSTHQDMKSTPLAGFFAGMPNLFQGSEEHTSELQSLMRISYAVFCLKKKKNSNSTIDKVKITTSYHTTHHTVNTYIPISQ